MEDGGVMEDGGLMEGRIVRPGPWALSFLLLVFVAAAAAAEEPRLTRAEDKRLRVERLPALLDDAEIQPQLTTGLTTSFSFRVGWRSRRAGRALGGARVEIRYELWDEAFQVMAIGFDGEVEQRSLPSFDALRAWWHDLELVLTRPIPELPETARARLTVDVLPFSESERDETQRWFTDALAAQSSGTEAAADAAEERLEPLDRVLHLLMATSIERQALLSFRYTLPVEST